MKNKVSSIKIHLLTIINLICKQSSKHFPMGFKLLQFLFNLIAIQTHSQSHMKKQIILWLLPSKIPISGICNSTFQFNRFVTFLTPNLSSTKLSSN